MNKNGGATALPPAVTSFISYFDESIDNIAEISFSTVASTDVQMTTSFDSPINSAVENLSFGGATFAQSGSAGRIYTDPEHTAVAERHPSRGLFYRRVGQH